MRPNFRYVRLKCLTYCGNMHDKENAIIALFTFGFVQQPVFSDDSLSPVPSLEPGPVDVEGFDRQDGGQTFLFVTLIPVG